MRGLRFNYILYTGEIHQGTVGMKRGTCWPCWILPSAFSGPILAFSLQMNSGAAFSGGHVAPTLINVLHER
jgi:hypothetical protein